MRVLFNPHARGQTRMRVVWELYKNWMTLFGWQLCSTHMCAVRRGWELSESCIRNEWPDLDESFVQLSCARSNEDESSWELTTVAQQTWETLSETLNMFKVDESARESMRVHENWRSNESGSLKSHQVSKTHVPVGPRYQEDVSLNWSHYTYLKVTKFSDY